MSADTGRQFVDTNVLVYAHDVSAGAKHQQARALLEELWGTGNGCLSVQVLQEFFVTVTRKVACPLDEDSAARIIAYLARWTMFVPDVADVLEAIRLHKRHGLSFWDAMVVRGASHLGCSVLWSEDLNPGQVLEGVAVRNPFVP